MPVDDVDFDYQLKDDAVVFDVGGFDGDFAAHIRNKYRCGVHIFEPVRKHFVSIMERFKMDPLMWPYNVALEREDKDGVINLRDNSSSIYFASESHEVIRIRDIWKFIQAFKLDHIDLMKLNCEGSEYAILDRIVSLGWIGNVGQIVVQFHDLPGKSKAEFQDILSRTHTRNSFSEHWEWWKLKS